MADAGRMLFFWVLVGHLFCVLSIRDDTQQLSQLLKHDEVDMGFGAFHSSLMAACDKDEPLLKEFPDNSKGEIWEECVGKFTAGMQSGWIIAAKCSSKCPPGVPKGKAVMIKKAINLGDAKYEVSAQAALTAKAGDHIAKLYWNQVHGGAHYIVMEVAKGETCGTRTGTQHKDWPEKEVMQAYCRSFSTIWLAGWAHGDVNGENEFHKKGDDKLQLIDFGFSRPLTGETLSKGGEGTGINALRRDLFWIGAKYRDYGHDLGEDYGGLSFADDTWDSKQPLYAKTKTCVKTLTDAYNNAKDAYDRTQSPHKKTGKWVEERKRQMDEAKVAEKNGLAVCLAKSAIALVKANIPVCK